MDSPFQEPGKIWDTKRPLDEDYRPDEIPCRDNEIDQLAGALQDVLEGFGPPNVFIYGQTGNGKTVVTKMVLDHLEEDAKKVGEELNIIWINCNRNDDLHKVLVEGCNQLRHPDNQVKRQGPNLSYLWETFYEELNKLQGNIILVLDEVDMLGPENDKLLYDLPRARSHGTLKDVNLGIIGISNDLLFENSLDSRVKSTLCEEKVEFPPYQAEELREILSIYAEKTFKDGVLTDDTVPLCASISAQDRGDARKALDLLETAGDLARRLDADKVGREHVYKAQEKVEEEKIKEIVQTKLTVQMQATLLGTLNAHLNREDIPRTQVIYEEYETICDGVGIDCRTKRRMGDFLDSLKMFGLLQQKENNRGRSSQQPGRAYVYTPDVEAELLYEALSEIGSEEDSRFEPVFPKVKPAMSALGLK